MEQDRRRDLMMVHALAHYIHDGGPYEWAVRSHLAIGHLDPGQELHFARIDDVSLLARTLRDPKRERGWGQ